jgi:hypothetical protein
MDRRVWLALPLSVLCLAHAPARAAEEACIFKPDELKPWFGEVREQTYPSRGPFGEAQCEYRAFRGPVTVVVRARMTPAKFKRLTDSAKTGSKHHELLKSVGDAAYFTDTGAAALKGKRSVAISGLRLMATGKPAGPEEVTRLLQAAVARLPD